MSLASCSYVPGPGRSFCAARQHAQGGLRHAAAAALRGPGSAAGAYLALREAVRAGAEAVTLLVPREEGGLELGRYGARCLRGGARLPSDEACSSAEGGSRSARSRGQRWRVRWRTSLHPPSSLLSDLSVADCFRLVHVLERVAQKRCGARRMEVCGQDCRSKNREKSSGNMRKYTKPQWPRPRRPHPRDTGRCVASRAAGGTKGSLLLFRGAVRCATTAAVAVHRRTAAAALARLGRGAERGGVVGAGRHQATRSGRYRWMGVVMGSALLPRVLLPSVLPPRAPLSLGGRRPALGEVRRVDGVGARQALRGALAREQRQLWGRGVAVVLQSRAPRAAAAHRAW